MTDTAMEAAGLGKRFGRSGPWGLRDCTFELPAGSVCALVGPNGAGKSTLLDLAAGLDVPTEGTVTLLGGERPAAVRARTGFVGQGRPLHQQLTVGETLRTGADLNPGCWDGPLAERILAGGDLDPKIRVRALSEGQRTRVALALALARRPELLLVDEPMAELDALARHELMGTLMAQVAEHGTTLVMSSHVVAELEGVCDHLVLLRDGRVRLYGEIDGLLDAHSVATGPAEAAGRLEQENVVESRTTGRMLTALVRTDDRPLPEGLEADRPSLEELVLAHLRAPLAADPATDAATDAVRSGEAAA
ncbi:ABC transporter ATP-binding protein [Streptomyces sp. NPDC048172]|uniref:ABC transporter ATP-binding protein n=1 Tax=Streptomyces sp. NPDC048172 TaxID=3365505 RepID=UPI00371BD9FE